jgi:hypothetical protein
MDFSEICKLGGLSYFDDGGIYRNPYHIGSAEFNEFERGWMQSLKRDGGRLVSEKKPPPFGSREPKPYNDTLSSAKINAERYRSRKG